MFFVPQKENGGIVMINFSNQFINCTAENALKKGRKYATMDQLIGAHLFSRFYWMKSDIVNKE